MFAIDAWIAQGHRCAYCREPMKRDDITADHVAALVRGGVTDRKNIKAACEPCNRTKGNMGETAFLKRIKNPQPGDSLHIWLAWSRRRIWLATERVCRKIERMVT